MKDDEVKLRLVVDVHYELGRTDVKDLERLLVKASEHLAGNGMLSGETEASVLTWNSTVETVKDGQAPPNINKVAIQKAIEDRLRGRLEAQRLTGKKARVEEASFIAGAASALQAVFGSDDKLTDYVPPMWMICPMTGRSVLDK